MPHTVGSDLTKSVGVLDERSLETEPLTQKYNQLIAGDRFSWNSNVKFLRTLGTGGQGTVFLSERFGADGFQVPVAVKVFSPDRYSSPKEYDDDMARIADVATSVSQIRHRNLLGINHFLNRDRIRVMIMEWVQGYDLRRLLTSRCYGIVKQRVSRKMWEVYNEQLVTCGPVQPRFRAQVTLMIMKEIVESLVALHDEGIIHGDIKPSNIMLNRAGSAKLIDIGSAVRQGEKSWRNGCTPTYASVDVLKGAAPTAESDLVSLGYTAMELLTGKPLFSDVLDLATLIDSKRQLENDFIECLPEEVLGDDNLIDLLACLLRSERFVAPAGFCATDLVQEMLVDVQTATPTSLIKVWVDELWEVDQCQEIEVDDLDPLSEF